MLPVLGTVAGLTLAAAAPHFGPIFPDLAVDGTATSTPLPGLFWLELTLLGCFFFTGLLMMAYETVATARYGRTRGKAWLRIRPLTLEGFRPGWGRAFGRVAIHWLFGWLTWLGSIDPLFCLWDDKRQCLHDKVAGTVVVNDPASPQR